MIGTRQVMQYLRRIKQQPGKKSIQLTATVLCNQFQGLWRRERPQDSIHLEPGGWGRKRPPENVCLQIFTELYGEDQGYRDARNLRIQSPAPLWYKCGMYVFLFIRLEENSWQLHIMLKYKTWWFVSREWKEILNSQLELLGLRIVDALTAAAREMD